MFERSDLPLRDILHIIVSGAYATLIVDIACFCAYGTRAFGNTDIVFPIALSGLFGLLFYSSDLHRKIHPWQPKWRAGMKRIRNELVTLTGDHLFLREDNWSKVLYKMQIDCLSNTAIRSHVHYETGMFYLMTSVCISTAVGTAFLAIVHIQQAIHLHSSFYSYVSDLWVTFPTSRLANQPIVIFVGGLLSWRSYRQSLRILDYIVNLALVILHSEKEQPNLMAIARAAAKAHAPELETGLMEQHVRAAIALHRPGDVSRIRAIQLDAELDQYDLRQDESKRLAHITIRSEYPTRLNGRENLYSGPLQQRLGTEVRLRLARRLNIHDVRLQMIGPNGFDMEAQARCPVGSKVPEVVRTSEAVELGIIKRGGAVHKCCSNYDIANVIIHNGRIIGPSPGLGAVFAAVLERVPNVGKVFDPFCGSGLVAQIARKRSPGVRVVSYDLVRAYEGYQHVDSFKVRMQEDYEIIVIDPYYEDLFAYLQLLRDTVGRPNSARWWIVQSGDQCDVSWNASVAAFINGMGVTVTTDFDQVEQFGKKILVVSF